jgi:23S rRNA pseudouridine1911/1915/1917 synthase
MAGVKLRFAGPIDIMKKLEVLFEDNHLLVVNKPAGLATQGALPGKTSLVVAAQSYLKGKYAKPGNVFVGVVSRLDSQVSGVIVLARTSKAAARLTSQFAESSVTKRYLALVPDVLNVPPQGELQHHVWKDDRAQRMRAETAPVRDSQVAKLRYKTLAEFADSRLLEVTLLTGRKHQIRVQLAAIGIPIVGDRKYDSEQYFPVGIALHSYFLSFEHPTKKETLTFRILPPDYWKLPTLPLD